MFLSLSREAFPGNDFFCFRETKLSKKKRNLLCGTELSIFEHMEKTGTTLLRSRVNSVRLEQAKRIWESLGIKPSEAINIFVAQTVKRGMLPFSIGCEEESHGGAMMAAEEQINHWNDALGEY